ncbi:MAG TPA: branched-chain amino acid ABC transporter substrate-binding protein [Acetobacteraceae bacterium]|jgi:branched-chain amino acid transport system substrate-binding protein|nr:branched-chain amino acid ABC transporter substrate-binding protein [Acetobacteraceae bacterium]
MLKRLGGALLAATIAFSAAPAAKAAEPITIGFGMALTGGLAPNGKAALLAMQIWEEEINAKGGLLGRPVKLVYYDDQSNPSTVPGIYTKLLDVDKVDFVISGYATNMVAPALPVVMQHNRLFLGLLGLAANSEFNYPNYFSIGPTGGPHPKQSFSKGFFEVAMAQNPKPQTIAFVGADAEFPRNALEGAHELAKEAGLKIVYDRTYPPTTNDYTPIVRGIQAANPDLVFVASYPPDSVGIIRAASEVGLKAKLFGGGMVGLQATAIKTQLGPLLNGIVDFDFWQPVGPYATPEAMDFLKRYQAKSPAAGVDLLGFYLPPFAYADMQVLQQAVTAVGSLDQQKVADYMRSHTFKTVAGDITFGPNGEWTEARVLEVQFQNVKGNDVEQFKDPKVEVVLYPPALKNGNLIYPYSDAKN